MGYTFYIWLTLALGQDLIMHAKFCTLSAFRFQNLRLGFEN